MYEVSIIVPIYNVQEYLEECLDSLCHQKNVITQVICVEDCSTDESKSILERYTDRFKHLEIYINEKNSGLAYSRNVGMKYAKGEYILFLDSDDYLASDVIYQLYKKAKKSDADILPYSVEMFNNDNFDSGLDLQRRVRKYSYVNDTGLNMMTRLVENNEMFGAAWGVMYKRKFLEEYHIHFIPGILHEDIPFTFEAFFWAPKACCVNETAYYYRQRNNSIMHNPDYGKMVDGLIMGYQKIKQIIETTDNRCSVKNIDAINKYLNSIRNMIVSKYLFAIGYGNEMKRVSEKYVLESLSFAAEESLDKYFSKKDLEKIIYEGEAVVYGAGKISCTIIYLLQKSGINVSQIYVTDIRNNPPNLFGIPVKEWRNAGNISDTIIVAVSKSNQSEVIGNLTKANITNYITTIMV